MEDLQLRFDEINNLIEDNEGEEACIEFFSLLKELEEKNYNKLDELYYDFALLLFENCFYDDCIKMFNKAYKLNYNNNEIKSFIFKNFITPNSSEFKLTYEYNIQNYCNRNLCKESIDYEKLPIEFIPVSNNKYYIFDLEKDIFEDSIDFTIEDTFFEDIHDEFSDILILGNYDLSRMSLYLDNQNNRTLYHICSNPFKTISFFKLNNINETFFKNLFLFTSVDEFMIFFRQNTSISLPRLIFSSPDKVYLKNDIDDFIKTEHEYRLSKEGRNNKSILLSIFIQSHNNGNEVLKTLMNLLNLTYDAEVEFIIINNSSSETLDYYKKIFLLKDSRISYFELSERLERGITLSKGLESAKGKFVLLLSAGDFLDTEALSYYMNLLKNNSNLGIIRTGTSSTYSNLEKVFIKKGESAFFHFFLNNNSINGTIYNNKLIDTLGITKSLCNSIEEKNYFSITYPNMYLDSFILLNGDFYSDPKMLCIENPSPSIDKPKNETDINSELGYSSYKNRINQHYGAISLLNELSLSKSALINAYNNLCWKTIFLVSLVMKKYIDNGYDSNKIYDEIYNSCIDGMDKFNLNFADNEKLLLETKIKEYNNQFKNN